MEPPAPPPGRVLDKLYLAASSAQLTIALAVLLAFTFAAAAILPQIPAGSDPLAEGRWLSTASARFGSFGTFLASSGLFNVLGGPWMIGLLAVTAFHLALRAANQVRRLITAPRGIPAAPPGLPFELVHLPLPVAELEPRIAALAPGQKPGLVVADLSGRRPRIDAYLARRVWAAAGPLLTYLGPLLVAFGLLWNTVAGWRVTGVTLLPGRTVQPAQAAGLALSLVRPSGPAGQPPAVVSLARGSQEHNAWLGHARPATWGPVWIAQRSRGPALAVRAAAGDAALPLQSLEEQAAPVDWLHLRFAENESEQAFTIPARNLAFRVVSYESLADRSADRPVFLIEGYEGTDPTPALSELVEDGGAIEWQGVTLTLQREAYVVVDLASMPGLPLLLAGALVLLAGVAISAWGGLTRTWLNAAAERDGALLAVRVAAPALGQAPVAKIAAALAVPGGDPPGARRAKAWLIYAAYTLAGALFLALVGAVALRGAGGATLPAARWPLLLHAVLALLGLGALVIAAGQSFWFALRGNRLSDVSDPLLRGPVQGLRGRAGDPGRGVSLAAFPLLTAAVMTGSVWGLLAAAAPIRAVPGQMWLLVAWLLGSAYFHATSGWRPLRAPGWLAPVLVITALAAGIAACLAAASLFIV